MTRATTHMHVDRVLKGLSEHQQRDVAAENARIAENKLTIGARPHNFQEAKWTHPNGHPRCLRCGDEEPISGRCDGDLSKAADHAGVMIALYPSPSDAKRLALKETGAEPWDELHITLLYPGKASEFSEGAITALKDAVMHVAHNQAPIQGKINGIGRFTGKDDEDAFYASFDAPELATFRYKLKNAVEDAGIYVNNDHGFSPHMTLTYLPADSFAPVERISDPLPLFFTAVSCVVGGVRTDYQLLTDPTEPAAKASTFDLSEPLIKANDEKRYTFSVVYKSSPDGFKDPELDAHREFATPEELFDASVGYVRGGDRSIYRQHGMLPGIGMQKIGEWVHIVQWPYEQDASFKMPNGTTVKRTIPADSVYMGTIWTPEIWPDIKAGRISGFSFGGKARRMTQD